MREVELKAVVDDWDGRRARVERAGGTLTFAGRLEDRRYDTPGRTLARRDEVLRLRLYRDGPRARAELGWKGATSREDGYKVREELAAGIVDAESLARVLEHLGYVITHAIDREIAQYSLGGAIVRFERYPRMDDLVEVEGAPEAIDAAIAALGISRAAFTPERLRDFVARYEAREGTRAALSDAELTGAATYDREDA
ncbi:MAG TPA: class IV adenylate cyclase [Gemmatimonadaceae bacterium]